MFCYYNRIASSEVQAMDPWAFGWTQVFAICGFIITIVIAVGGFRTFGRWKREKIEERRIDTALDALAVVYEAKYIFDNIRSPMSFGYEWESMPQLPGDSEQKRGQRGPFYASLKRIEANKDFFERLWKVQTRCIALFGTEVEETFLRLHKGRRKVEVSAGMLYRDPYPEYVTEDNKRTWESFRNDVWAQNSLEPEDDKIGRQLELFRTEMESLCRPIIDKGLGRPNARLR
jgi:hypothetical protein